ncbi:MAG: hypothetical protein HC770_08830 [Pseudanabaena sp. CRU_2_10]|nr:hypothetical protein [Pseudanabaena sp. CRU_2_10]
MLTFLFWNLNGKNLISSLAELVVTHEVDILILAECIDPQNLLQSLNLLGKEAQFHHIPSPLPKHRIQLFTSFLANFAMPFMEDTHYTMRRLTLPGCDEVLLVAAHLLSLREATEDTVNEEAKSFADENTTS